MQFRTDDQRRRNGGLTRSLQKAHVIDGKLVTTAQAAKELGVSVSAAYRRIKCRVHPLTWESLRQKGMKA